MCVDKKYNETYLLIFIILTLLLATAFYVQYEIEFQKANDGTIKLPDSFVEAFLFGIFAMFLLYSGYKFYNGGYENISRFLYIIGYLFTLAFFLIMISMFLSDLMFAVSGEINLNTSPNTWEWMKNLLSVIIHQLSNDPNMLIIYSGLCIFLAGGIFLTLYFKREGQKPKRY